ncbi:TetR/AcrR family transcriptional regulator [Shimazuella kribbensis]|uniref:TetR/AcrR family transcriptional regulator n=1 Tax=Shimazuella kribbensis TaxID=139808 RepID=UPI0003F8A36B|nr:TetR/AcrR family transcriptional regulator [Shimazuella kribbensis]
MDGYILRTEKKKEQILRTAFDLLCNYGAKKMSIAEVAKKANVSPVTIYNYFESKDQLIRSTLFFIMENRIAEYETILSQDIPFHKKMKRIMIDQEETAKNIQINSLQSHLDNVVVKAFMEEFYQKKTRPFFTKLVNEGKKEGSIHPDVSLESILFYIHMFKEALAKPGFFAQTNPSMLRDLDHLLYYGLIGRPQTEK